MKPSWQDSASFLIHKVIHFLCILIIIIIIITTIPCVMTLFIKLYVFQCSIVLSHAQATNQPNDQSTHQPTTNNNSRASSQWYLYGFLQVYPRDSHVSSCFPMLRIWWFRVEAHDHLLDAVQWNKHGFFFGGGKKTHPKSNETKYLHPSCLHQNIYCFLVLRSFLGSFPGFPMYIRFYVWMCKHSCVNVIWLH